MTDSNRDNGSLRIDAAGLSGHILAVARERIDRMGMPVDKVKSYVEQRLGFAVDMKVFREAAEHIVPLIDVEGKVIYPSAELLRAKASSFFDARRSARRREKRAVAKHIHDNMMSTLGAVFLDGGSACEAIAEEMARGSKGQFTVMTNNRKAVKAFMTNENIRIHLTGGIYKYDDEMYVGRDAVFDPGRFNVKYAVVGVSGITPTHVYNHDILGEEFIKKQYWQLPAEWLIVPATLRKFEGKDASCFGVLCHAAPERGSIGGDVFAAMNDAIESRRSDWFKQKYGNENDVERPRFRADECVIVVEPEWMIEESFKDNRRQMEALWAKVDEINRNSRATRVKVEFADVKREQLSDLDCDV